MRPYGHVGRPVGTALRPTTWAHASVCRGALVLASTAAFTVSGLAVAEEPRRAGELTCAQVIDLYDTLERSCSGLSCGELAAEDAAAREALSRTIADCAARYEWVLSRVAERCEKNPYEEGFFSFFSEAIRLWRAAYDCVANEAHALYLERALTHVERGLAGQEALGDEASPTIVSFLEGRRGELTALLDRAAPTPDDDVPASRPSPPAPDLLENFSLRLGVGIGGILRLVETGVQTSEYRGEGLAAASRFAAGARLLLGAKRRLVLGLGVEYALIGQSLQAFDPKQATSDLVHPLHKAGVVWLHHLGPFARAGYRVHVDQLLIYSQLGVGLQVFSMGANFGTNAVESGGGACVLWQVLCVDALYYAGWGGGASLERPTNFASGWTATISADVLRIPAAVAATAGSG